MFTAEREPNLAFQGILNSVFHRVETGEGIVIAFTSATSGEGVSYVSERIASQLSATSPGVRRISSGDLLEDIWPIGPAAPRTAWENWRSKVMQMRARHRYTIIDCPSL